MQPKSLKYLLDIESVVIEIENIKENYLPNFFSFSSNFILQRAIERELEIIGEAVRNLKIIEPDIAISGCNKIIGLRNIISHSYDSIQPELLWGIIQRDIPVLSEEIAKLKR